MFNKTLAGQIEAYFEKTAKHDKVGFTPKMQAWFNILTSINVIKNDEEKKHKIISIDTEKVFDKIQQPLG